MNSSYQAPINGAEPTANPDEELPNLAISGGEALGLRRLDAAFTAQRRRQAAAIQGVLRTRELIVK